MENAEETRSVIDVEAVRDGDLLRLHGAILDELKSRGVVRSKNNPVGDYAERLVAKALDLTLAPKSQRGFDALSSDGTRYEVKARRVTPDNKSRQLSAIRNLMSDRFDYLAAVLFDASFEIIEAVKIPRDVVAEYATYRRHVNAHILHVRGPLLYDPRVTRLELSADAS